MSLSVTVLKVSFKDLFIISTEQGIRSNKENYRINIGNYRKIIYNGEN